MKSRTTSTARTRSKAADAPLATQDHRVRNGAVRREQTRRRLLTSAMAVFAEKGIDAPLIDDFIAAAGVARGTFYNHFSTTQELLDAVTSELSNVVMSSIDKVVLPIKDPLQRMACGCLLYMHLGVSLPNWATFVIHTGLRSRSAGTDVNVYLPRDLEQARKAGLVDYTNVRAARDLMFAAVSQATQSVLSEQEPLEHLRQVMALALRGVGVPSARALELSQMPLPEVELPADLFDVSP